MSQARMAAMFAKCVAKCKFPDDAEGMESICCEWLAVFDRATSVGSHKYIPAAKLSADLGLPEGAGVYGYRMYPDGSHLLMTCGGRVAHWDGKDAKAVWE